MVRNDVIKFYSWRATTQEGRAPDSTHTKSSSKGRINGTDDIKAQTKPCWKNSSVTFSLHCLLSSHGLQGLQMSAHFRAIFGTTEHISTTTARRLTERAGGFRPAARNDGGWRCSSTGPPGPGAAGTWTGNRSVCWCLWPGSTNPGPPPCSGWRERQTGPAVECFSFAVCVCGWSGGVSRWVSDRPVLRGQMRE